MSQMELFEENLSQELLAENAVASNVKTTSILEINMARNPFKSLKEVPSFPANKTKLHPQESGDNKTAIPKRVLSKKLHSNCPLIRSEIQTDIRNLLQKAIKIRNICVNDPDIEAKPSLHFGKKLEPVHKRPGKTQKKIRMHYKKSQSLEYKDVTMRDIQNAI